MARRGYGFDRHVIELMKNTTGENTNEGRKVISEITFRAS